MKKAANLYIEKKFEEAAIKYRRCIDNIRGEIKDETKDEIKTEEVDYTFNFFFNRLGDR